MTNGLPPVLSDWRGGVPLYLSHYLIFTSPLLEEKSNVEGRKREKPQAGRYLIYLFKIVILWFLEKREV
jgi:hypothetical protein